MTYQEAEKLIDETFRETGITFIKIIVAILIGAVILCCIDNSLESLWESFKYWLDCKKWDKEHKEKK
jgi:hypothetical protein